MSKMGGSGNPRINQNNLYLITKQIVNKKLKKERKIDYLKLFNFC